MCIGTIVDNLLWEMFFDYTYSNHPNTVSDTRDIHPGTLQAPLLSPLRILTEISFHDIFLLKYFITHFPFANIIYFLTS